MFSSTWKDRQQPTLIWKTGPQLDTHGTQPGMRWPLCPCGRDGQNGPGVLFPEKGGKGGIDSPTHTGKGGEFVLLELLKELCFASTENCLLSSSQVFQGTWVISCFFSQFGRDGLMRL